MGKKKPGPKPDPTRPKSRHNPQAQGRGQSEMRVDRQWVRPKATDEHCAHGHPWDEHTLMTQHGKYRQCRYCSYLSQCRREKREPLSFDDWVLYRERRATQCKNGHLWAEHGYQTEQGYWRCKKCWVDSRRRSLYGIEPEQYDALNDKQSGKCAGCLVSLDSLNIRDVHIDHHHGTGAVRGLLCSRCNLTLGNVQDNPDTLRRLADYISE